MSWGAWRAGRGRVRRQQGGLGVDLPARVPHGAEEYVPGSMSHTAGADQGSRQREPEQGPTAGVVPSLCQTHPGGWRGELKCPLGTRVVMAWYRSWVQPRQGLGGHNLPEPMTSLTSLSP